MFYLIVFGIGIFFTSIVYFLHEYDNRKDYSNIDIFYIITEKYIFIPKKFAKPHYDSEVKERFEPGKIIVYNNVHTGFIRILQFISNAYCEKNETGNTKYYYQYSYEIYNPEEIFTGLTPSIGDLYIGTLNIVLNKVNNELKISENDLNYLMEFIVDSNRGLRNGELKKFDKVINALIDCLPGSKYIKLIKVLSEQIHNRGVSE